MVSIFRTAASRAEKAEEKNIKEQESKLRV